MEWKTLCRRALAYKFILMKMEKMCKSMGVPSEISLPTNKPDIRPNLGEGVRWSQIRLDQPLDQEGRKKIRLDQP